MPALFVPLKATQSKIEMLEVILERNDVVLVLVSDLLSLKQVSAELEFDLFHL